MTAAEWNVYTSTGDQLRGAPLTKDEGWPRELQASIACMGRSKCGGVPDGMVPLGKVVLLPSPSNKTES